MYHYVIALVGILVSWCILSYVRWKKTVFDPIEKIRGPKWYPVIGTLHIFKDAKRSDLYKVIRKTTDEYKPLFRTWSGFRPEVHVVKPEHLEQIMASSVQIKKGTMYVFLKEWLGQGLLLSDGQKWFKRRKMITPTFHFKILDNFMAVFQEKSKLLIDHLEEKSTGTPFDVYPYITHCALDVICETAMGVPINAMTDRNSKYARAIYSSSELIFKRIFSPLQQTQLYPLLPDGKKFNQSLKIMHEFTDKVIAERRKALKQNPLKRQNVDDPGLLLKTRLSFLDLLLEASDKLSDADIREEVDTFMFEGHDTTTAAMSWCLMLLANNQDIQEKVFQEVRDILHDNKTPSSLSELNEMRYLECCIKEALRLYPSVPFIGRVISEDVVIDGYHVPKGTDFNLHIFDTHRIPEIYPEPEKFDPDRFLPENTANRHAYAYVPFSAGPRNCIGQKFAIYEEKTILSSIIRSYKILPVDTVKSVEMVFELILRPMNGLKIALEKRTD